MSEDFRIAIIGQAAFGESVLSSLIKKGDNIVGAFCPPQKEGKPSDPMEAAADEHGVAAFQFKRMRDAEAIEGFRALNADLCVMAFVTDIVPMEILTAPRLGTIQYHPSLLPKFRGPSSINWPIIQGETKTGLTIFWPDEGLDTGPVLLRKETVIEPDDSLGSLYFDKLFPMGVEAMVEAVSMVKAGTAPKLVQDESAATYQSWCRAKDLVIDWSQGIDSVYNMIRGGDPSPGANSVFAGATLSFFGASKRAAESGYSPSEVTEVTDEGFAAASVGGSVFISKVRPEGGRKVSAGEWARSVALKPGDRFGA